jgi:hypothetical protein
VRPEQPYRALRAAVGTIVIGTFVAIWAYAQLYAEPMGTLWALVMLVLLVASGYAVFGRATMTSAVEDAQELQGDQEGDDGA